MRAPIRFALAALAILVLVTVARVLADPATGNHPVGPTAVVLPPADPMAVELQAAIERSQRDYGELFRRLATARNEEDAFAVQDEMRQRRVGLQVELLRIQAAYARRAGRERLAVQLERTVAELIAPDGAVRVTPAEHGKL
jgi:hypothetical protein